MEARLGEAGLAPRRESFVAQATPAGDVPMCNVYADLAPKSAAVDAPLVILGSHYDTKRLGPKFVGANDGGSSTAVLLELARILAENPPERLALRFLFLDGEEAFNKQWAGKDNTYGSRHHADAIRSQAALFARLKAFVLLDLVGDRDLKLTTDRNSTLSLRDLFTAVARENGLAEIVGGFEQEIKDDHLSFRKHNVDAIDLIDLDYPWWHTDEDTLDKCAPESLGKIGKLVLHAIPRLEERYAPPLSR
jgi:Zn-dependent M28 family amino/carboxypeptidase